jgi:hypothetical protein
MFVDMFDLDEQLDQTSSLRPHAVLAAHLFILIDAISINSWQAILHICVYQLPFMKLECASLANCK